MKIKLASGQVRLVLEDAALGPGAALKVGDKIIIKQVDSWTRAMHYVQFYWMDGEIGAATVGWLERWTALL